MELVQRRAELARVQEPLSKTSRIGLLLNDLQIRRQAELGPRDLEVLSNDLKTFDLRDIEAGLERLGKQPRREFDTAFPDCGTLIESVCRGEKREA